MLRCCRQNAPPGANDDNFRVRGAGGTLIAADGDHFRGLRVLGAVGVSLEDHGPGAAERTGREQIRELRGLARVVRRDAEVHVGCSSPGEA